MNVNRNAELPLLASCRFGLESVLASELKALGASELRCENALVRFCGSWELLARANIRLRTAERIFWEIKRFEAKSFEELFEQCYAVDWADLFAKEDAVIVKGKTAKSQLHSVSDCQSIVKKAIVEKMKKRYKLNWFPENGRSYTLEVALLDNQASLLLDASGAGLSRRGYRRHHGEAPLPETIAAGMLLLSRWDGQGTVIDPFCGSGTIAIEAALIAQNKAPGLERDFAAESWAWISGSLWNKERSAANAAETKGENARIIVSDNDVKIVDAARYNAAALDFPLEFHCDDARTLRLPEAGAMIVCNPPYGERMMEHEEARSLYRAFGQNLREQKAWKLSALTADAEFERYFGARADKRRKIYNGSLPCQLYQYFKRR